MGYERGREGRRTDVGTVDGLSGGLEAESDVLVPSLVLGGNLLQAYMSCKMFVRPIAQPIAEPDATRPQPANHRFPRDDAANQPIPRHERQPNSK